MAYALRTKDNALDAGRAADQNESVDNDIFFQTVVHDGTDWVTWDADPQGWSSFTKEFTRYKRIGDLVICEMRIEGTSNATTKTATAPFVCATRSVGDGGAVVAGLISDNGGAYQWGYSGIDQGSSTIVFRSGPTGPVVPWTNSGTCDIFRHLLIYDTDA